MENKLLFESTLIHELSHLSYGSTDDHYSEIVSEDVKQELSELVEELKSSLAGEDADAD